MNEQKLSKRLAHVASYVEPGARVADIGSDHAYLPAWLYLNGKIEAAVAGEVVQGPFESAKKLVETRGLSEHITVRLANGLEAVEKNDQIDTVTIAGMGGSLISDILDRGVNKGILTGKERLILQPNIGEKRLRKWLVKYKYQLIAEEILEEDGKRYEILVAEKAVEAPSYSDQELLFGPFLLEEKSPIFLEKWASELVQKQRILAQLETTNNDHQAKISELKQVVKWIEELRA
ncbi:tRNA (adenine(22)-N(1))-methyltransferase [Vagococcus intermedius]|uniref:tRNA (Adenine(22)-N(1))-methyltransferase TrmK n=1 Tax=Vagococcus intermedius TaxID=2991418 RepID=A0AAF0I836_9ENTE|nr:tRNA (adenine(22)-N(1))-methyltransferase TrmK [Vagococcus intermedius]WEG73950.1 tRNA (adenine(22)-N(1))-methyltransferase TrmK [Vagococcus intermedius]WEG76030.1 tRNA (adenine(22)-N(1))-methyltransferase TrmK [Vagococcus intermedius]